MRILATFGIVVLLQSILFCQSPSLFAETVRACYSDAKFADFSYRFAHEGDCFIGLKFPEFEMEDLEGRLVSHVDFDDKVVVLNFWFTGCPPCLEEIPYFNELSLFFKKRDVLFLAPSTDDVETIEVFFEQYGRLNSRVLPHSEIFFREVLACKAGFPTTIVVDKQGIIRYFYAGGITEEHDLRGIIERLADE